MQSPDMLEVTFNLPDAIIDEETNEPLEIDKGFTYYI